MLFSSLLGKVRLAKMLRLLHCIHSLSPAGGGPADFVVQCARLQESYDIELEVACLDEPGAEWLQDFPAKVHAFGPGSAGYGFAADFAHWIRLNCRQYDLVVINGLWQFSSAGTWWALRNSNTPYVVFPHGMLDPWFNEKYRLKQIKKQIFWLLAEYRVLRDARAVMFTSEEEKVRAATSFFPYVAKPMVAPYGTAAPPGEVSEYRERFFLRNPQLRDRRLLVYLGRVHPKKGCDLLLRTFCKLHEQGSTLHLIVAGPADVVYESELRKLWQNHGAITRLDMVSGAEKWELLSAADALILPSHQENFARVVSEALSCSTPVLLSDKVNIWRDVVADQAGLVAADTEQGVEQLIRSFLALSDQQRQNMREKAKSCFNARFDMHKNFGLYLQQLETLSGRTNAP